MSAAGYRELELERERQEQLRLRQVRSECESLATECREAIRGVRDVAVQQLAAEALRDVAARLEAARDTISSSPDTARRTLEALSADAERAIARGEAEARAWSEAQATAVATARHAHRLTVIAGGEGNGEARDAGDRAIRAAEQGDLERASALAEEARDRAAQASADALDETIRREVVKGLLRTLKGMGFVVAGPKLDDGRVTLEGKLASGRRAWFEISLDGRMGFDLDGYEGRACADDLEKVETTLRDQFGVRLGPSQVTWKNPDRLTKGARDLPGGAAQKRKGR